MARDMHSHNAPAKARSFTLLELLLVVGILALFLYLCSNTVIMTLVTKDLIEKDYAEGRVKGIGWNIIYQDLGNVVGVRYLDGTTPVTAPPPQAETKDEKQKEDKKDEESSKKEPIKETTVPRLLLFEAEPKRDEPFLTVVVSRGRYPQKDSSGESSNKLSSKKTVSGLGFRLVKYYVMDHPAGEGQVLMRTEEPWIEDPKKKDEYASGPSDEKINFSRDYQRYTIMEDYDNYKLQVYNGRKWIKKWDALEKKDLPLALKITCEKMNVAQGEEAEIQKIVPIPLSYVPIEKPEDELF